MAKGMKISEVDDYWKYLFYRKKRQWSGARGRSYICTAKYFLVFLRRKVNLPESKHRTLSRMIHDFPEWSKS